MKFSTFDEAWVWLRAEGEEKDLNDWLGAVFRLATQGRRPIPDGIMTGFASWVNAQGWMSWQEAQSLLLPPA